MADQKLLDNLLKASDLPAEVTPCSLSNPAFLEDYPAVAEVLYSRESSNGKRLPAKLTLFVDQRQMKVCVTLPTEGLMAFLTLSNPGDLWQVLENKISSDELEWREDKRSRRPR